MTKGKVIYLKEYTVREISELLSTNEDTVRRWIREGKLKSTITSKKTGHRVSEENLEEFRKLYPKLLSGTVGASIGASVGMGMLNMLLPGAGVVASIATLGSAAMVGMKAAKNETQNYEAKHLEKESPEAVQAEQLVEFLNEEITRIEKANLENQKRIDAYRKQIEVLESQIATNKKQIDTYRKQIEITNELKGE